MGSRSSASFFTRTFFGTLGGAELILEREGREGGGAVGRSDDTAGPAAYRARAEEKQPTAPNRLDGLFPLDSQALPKLVPNRAATVEHDSLPPGVTCYRPAEVVPGAPRSQE